MGDTFEARDLWASMGMPYFEPDKIEPILVTAVRTMIFAGRWQVGCGLSADAFRAAPGGGLFGGFGALACDAEVAPA